MSWTYNPALPSERDQVRFLIQDTNTSKQLFQDSEIDWVLTQEMNVYTAAASLCDTLVFKAGAVRAKKIGDFGITYDPSLYRTLGGSLRARGMGHQVPYAGGLTNSDKSTLQLDTDAVQPSISRGQSDNPAAPKADIDPLTQV